MEKKGLRRKVLRHGTLRRGTEGNKIRDAANYNFEACGSSGISRSALAVHVRRRRLVGLNEVISWPVMRV
jgi:hypothetical protein